MTRFTKIRSQFIFLFFHKYFFYFYRVYFLLRFPILLKLSVIPHFFALFIPPFTFCKDCLWLFIDSFHRNSSIPILFPYLCHDAS